MSKIMFLLLLAILIFFGAIFLFVGGCTNSSVMAGGFRDPFCDGIHLKPEGVLIETWGIAEPGDYLYFFSGQVANNEDGANHNIVFQARLFLNGNRILDFGFNVIPAMHYGWFTLPWAGWLDRNDVLELYLHADSDAGFRDGSAVLLTCDGCISSSLLRRVEL